ncbi:putative nuclease HARBI1 [Sitophilus oryzae]|uniref:Nuclease HARBI1 n=1 Tax=Sitophilus oryzae TaxID=7048 RepID=A0A6J2YV27_SITOR|nr:putative nuclease HARBI1 [Sitophilus oryzae]
MFNASLLCASLEAGEYQGGYLLGDRAYSCKEYLSTPLLNSNTVAETNYNSAHIQTRNCIERSFGVWKRRFACLSLGLRTKLETSLLVIVATAVLHNIALVKSDYFEDGVVEEKLVEDIILPNVQHNAGGNALRRSLIENHFR